MNVAKTGPLLSRSVLHDMIPIHGTFGGERYCSSVIVEEMFSGFLGKRTGHRLIKAEIRHRNQHQFILSLSGSAKPFMTFFYTSKLLPQPLQVKGREAPPCPSK